MTATAQTAHDAKGNPIFIGDEFIARFKTVDVRDGSVMGTSFEPPYREYWFHGALIERTAQGKASFEADRQAAIGKTAAAPVAEAPNPADPAKTIELSLREQAIAHVMSKGRDRAAAEKVVEEYGTRMILEDRDEEAKADKARELAEASAGSAPASQQSSGPADAGSAAGTAQNEAPAPDAKKPAEGTGAA
jgi:hypothetical protein